MSELRLTAILKVDLRGSTPLFQALTQDQLRDLLEEQKRLVSQLVAQHGGHLVKGEGDAFWVTFPSVTAAAETALQIQRAMRAAQAGKFDEQRLALKIVITAGDVLHHNHDIFGHAANLAARIEAVTPPEHIYLSHAAWLALNQAEINTAFVEEFNFKGVAQPEKIYQLVEGQRSIILPAQVIVMSDLSNFLAFQTTATLPQIEELLLHLAQTVKATCHAHAGQVRVGNGDSFVLTFPDAARAFPALTQLCHTWDRYRDAHQLPCALYLGAHWGPLAIFRSFAYGEALYLTGTLLQLAKPPVGAPRPHSRLTVSSLLHAQVVGTAWETGLTLIAPEHYPARLRATPYQAYELAFPAR